MFREWGFLLGEIWVLLLLAALLGLLVGWLLWGRKAAALSAELDASRYAAKEKQARISSLEEELRALRTKQSSEAASLRGELETRDQKIVALTGQVEHGASAMSADVARLRDTNAQKDARISELEADLAACKASKSADVVSFASGAAATGAAAGALHERPAQFTGQDYDGDGVVEGKNEGSKPQVLSGPREGRADDLKQIKGVGPKLEKLLHSLGFYHFDQVASWGAQEVAWVDANLEGFTGRVSRDEWVAQAKVLAAGGATEFSKRVDGGDVY